MSKRSSCGNSSCGRGYNRKVPPSRRNKKCRKLYDKPLKKRKGYVRVCATYYYWKGRK